MVAVFAQVLLPIVIVVGAGYLLRRCVALDLRSINRLSIYLFSPALIFTLLTQVQITPGESLRIVAFMTTFCLCSGALTFLVCRVLGYDQVHTAALLLCAMFMNAGNYGLPVARFAFGEEGFQRAALFFVVQSILAQTLAVGIAASSGLGSWQAGLARLLQMPQVYAVLGALAFRALGLELNADGARVVDELFRGVALLADASVPLLLAILGMQLAESARLAEPGQVTLGLVLRLGLAVPLALALIWLLGLEGLDTQLALVLTSMPTAVNMIILALEFNVRPRLVADVVTASTLASLFSLTLLLAWVR